MDRIMEIEIAVEDFHCFKESRYRRRAEIVKDVEYLLERLKVAEGDKEITVKVIPRFQDSTGDG